MKVVYSALYREFYPFHTLAEQHTVVHTPNQLVETDSVLLIWGGEDIDPSIYNHPRSKTTYFNPDRDKREIALAKQAMKLGIPIIGVCRGAQLLCALAGGFLVQDIRQHATGGRHFIRTHDNGLMLTNTLHHQMMAGYEKLPHKLLAWVDEPTTSTYTYMDDRAYTPPPGHKDPEAIWFPDIKGLAIQWHPEMMDGCEATKFVIKSFNELNYVHS